MRLIPLFLVVAGLTLAQEPVVTKPARVRLGGFAVGAGYSHFSGPGYFGYRPYLYDPWFYGGFSDFYHPGYYGGYLRGPDMGEVKLSGVPHDAEIFLDGGFAGDAHHLKSMWLRPGKYVLEVRDHGNTFSKTIYVLTGKTIRVEPVFTAAGGPRS